MSTLFPHTLNVSFNILDNLPQHLPYLDNSIMNTFLFCGRCMLYFVTAVYMWVAFSPKKKQSMLDQLKSLQLSLFCSSFVETHNSKMQDGKI